MEIVQAKYSVFTEGNVPYYLVRGLCPECGHEVWYSEEFEMKPHYNRITIDCDDCGCEFKMQWNAPET